MFGFDTQHHDANQDNYQQVYQENGDFHNEASTEHRVIAGAAAFAGMAMYEHKQREEGIQVKHAFAKECIVAFAGEEADKLAESKGEDFYDREKAKHEAKKQSENMFNAQYGDDPEKVFQPHSREETYGGFTQEGRSFPQMNERQEAMYQDQRQMVSAY